MAAEGQSDRMVSDVEVGMKQRHVIKFFHAEKKMAPTDFHLQLLRVCRDQTVDVSTVRWVVQFSSDNSGSPPLVQICRSTVCRLLFVLGKNA